MIEREPLSTDERDYLVMAWYIQGMTQRAIAKRLGVSPARIWQLKRRAWRRFCQNGMRGAL